MTIIHLISGEDHGGDSSYNAALKTKCGLAKSSPDREYVSVYSRNDHLVNCEKCLEDNFNE